MTLFTKDGCTGCEDIKRNFDLTRLGIEVKVLGEDNADALAELAWYGLVEAARKDLPILAGDDMTPVRGWEAVRDDLIRRSYVLNAA
ncbi:MAG: hypothetical protein V2A77_04095 [Pseudomonadota bacterium]